MPTAMGNGHVKVCKACGKGTSKSERAACKSCGGTAFFSRRDAELLEWLQSLRAKQLLTLLRAKGMPPPVACEKRELVERLAAVLADAAEGRSLLTLGDRGRQPTTRPAEPSPISRFRGADGKVLYRVHARVWRVTTTAGSRGHEGHEGRRPPRLEPAKTGRLEESERTAIRRTLEALSLWARVRMSGCACGKSEPPTSQTPPLSPPPGRPRFFPRGGPRGSRHGAWHRLRLQVLSGARGPGETLCSFRGTRFVQAALARGNGSAWASGYGALDFFFPMNHRGRAEGLAAMEATNARNIAHSKHPATLSSRDLGCAALDASQRPPRPLQDLLVTC